MSFGSTGDRRSSTSGRFTQRLSGRISALSRTNRSDNEGVARVRGRAIYILPTGAGALFGGILLLMLLGSLNYQNNLGLLFTFVIAAVVVVAMHHTWFNLRGLQVTAHGGAPVFAGEEAAFTVSLTHAGRRRRGAIGIVLGRQRTTPVGVDPGGSASAGLRLQARERGRLQLPRIRVETGYPFGLFRAWCYVEMRAAVTVYPRPATRSPELPLIPAYRRSAMGDRGVGADDFVGLRGYHAGDSLRHVDWKALGRERGLMVKQFGGDRAEEVWLDWNRLPAADAETRLSLLCRQVLDASEGEMSFGVRLPEREVRMGRGDVHKHRCLEALARHGRD